MRRIIIYSILLLLMCPLSSYAIESGGAGAANNESLTGDLSITGGLTVSGASTLSDKHDRNDVAVDDDSCVGEQGLWWYDSTDSRFEFCNSNSGAPDVLGGGSFTDIDTDYGTETVTSAWVFNPNGTGAFGAYDLTLGNTGNHGSLRIGDAGIYVSSYGTGNIDLGQSMVFRQEGNLDAGNDPGIEFAFIENVANSIRIAIPESGSGNATAFIRSGTFAGPYSTSIGNDIVLCDQWTSYDSNIDCDTGGSGADLFVQDDFEVEGEIFSSGSIFLDADDANQLEIASANITSDRLFTFPDDQIADTELLVGNGGGTFTFVPVSGDATITNAGAVAVSDLTISSQAQGDILYFNGSNWVRLAKGTAGQVLEMNSGATAPEWDTDDSGAGGSSRWTDEPTFSRTDDNTISITASDCSDWQPGTPLRFSSSGAPSTYYYGMVDTCSGTSTLTVDFFGHPLETDKDDNLEYGVPEALTHIQLIGVGNCSVSDTWFPKYFWTGQDAYLVAAFLYVDTQATGAALELNIELNGTNALDTEFSLAVSTTQTDSGTTIDDTTYANALIEQEEFVEVSVSQCGSTIPGGSAAWGKLTFVTP